MEMVDAMAMQPWLKPCFLKKLNKFISFDPFKWHFRMWSGVLLSEILEITVPQRLFLAITQELNLLHWEENYCF